MRHNKPYFVSLKAKNGISSLKVKQKKTKFKNTVKYKWTIIFLFIA